MRIGLVSDSHGDVDLLGRALDQLARAQVDRVFFLGGRLADLTRALASARDAGPRPAPAPGGAGAAPTLLAALDGRVVRVASRACPEYARDPSARRVVELVEGRVCCLVHDKAELTREDIANAAVIFHGNSPRAALVQIGPRCFVTPGQLRRDGEPPTFAVLEASARELVLAVHSPSGTELRRERASLAPGAKLSVRG